MKKLWLGVALSGVVALGMGILFVSRHTKEPEEVVIGVILPLSGNTAWLGHQHRWGIDLAIQELNAAGGVSGRKIKLVYEDDKNEPLEAVNAFTRLVSTYDLSVVITAMSSSSMAILPRAEEEEIVLYANCGHPQIAELSKWVFRNFLTAAQEAEAMASLCVNELGIHKLAIFYIDDAYGEGGKDAMKAYYQQYGGTVIALEKYNKNGTNFLTEITKALSRHPPAIWVFGYGNAAGILLRQLKEQGFDGLVLGTSNFVSAPLTDVAGNALEGSIFTTPYFDHRLADENIQKFISKINREYNGKAQWNTANAYDGVFIIVSAMEKCVDFTGRKLRKALMSIGDYKGIAGNYVYFPNGEWRVDLVIRTYKNGELMPFNTTQGGE